MKRKLSLLAVAVAAAVFSLWWALSAVSNQALLPQPLQPFGSHAQGGASVAQLSDPTVDGADDGASGCGGDAPGMANPAAVYCHELGYQYEIVDTAEGQYGICVFPDGSKCDEWGFLEGKCGQSYSYCAGQGYELVTKSDGKNPFSVEYGVCVRDGQEIGSVTELMGLGEKATKGSRQVEQAPNPPEEEVAVGVPPALFDWRNYNGQDWMTSVKDQASCGGCWAFSAIGTMEAVNNIAASNPSLDLNLSEEYLVSDCYSDLDQSCCGGWQSQALQFIRDSGIPDDACLPWASGTCYCDPVTGCSTTLCTYHTGGACANRTCSQKCGDWASRLETIGSMSKVSTTPTRIKQAVVDRGPLSVTMGVQTPAGGYFDGSNVYRCTDDSVLNHVVIIVGYNDAGYWIVKNSWGATWGPDGNGYFKVGYGECGIETDVYYASLVDQACTSYTSTDVPKAIPDAGSPVTSNINVGDSFTLTNVNVGPLTITHTWDEDLDVFLISPAGTRVELFTDVGGSGDNFVNTILDDESVYPIAINPAPFTWTLSPEGVLADLNGESSLGQWRLEVTDDTPFDAGTLNSWELELCHDVGSTGGGDSIGLHQLSTGVWYLRNTNSGGVADLAFSYGGGLTGVTPVAGDWNNDATDTIGLYRASDGMWFLRNANSGGMADLTFSFGGGITGAIPVVGDWDNDGDDTIGLYRPSDGMWFLRNTNSGGVADLTFSFGASITGAIPVVGDWDNDGDHTIGLYRWSDGMWFLRNTNSTGPADLTFSFGAGLSGVGPLVGDWDNDGDDTIGLYTTVGTWYLRNANSSGVADLTFSYGAGMVGSPQQLAGNWDGS